MKFCVGTVTCIRNRITLSYSLGLQITSAGLWSQNNPEPGVTDAPTAENIPETVEESNLENEFASLGPKFLLNTVAPGARKKKLEVEIQQQVNGLAPEHPMESSKQIYDDGNVKTEKEGPQNNFFLSAKETIKAAFLHFGKKWYRRLLFIWRHSTRIVGSFWKLWVSESRELYS